MASTMAESSRASTADLSWPVSEDENADPYASSFDVDAERESSWTETEKEAEQRASVANSGRQPRLSAPLPLIPALFQDVVHVAPPSPAQVMFPTRVSFVNGVNQATRKRAISLAPARTVQHKDAEDDAEAYARRASLPVFWSTALPVDHATEKPWTRPLPREPIEDERPTYDEPFAANRSAPQRDSLPTMPAMKTSRRKQFFRSVFGRR